MDTVAKSETQKWMESAYASFRLDGYTHEQAMAKIKAAMDEAIPQAVSQIMSEIRSSSPPPICKPCKGFGYIGPAKCPDCAGQGRVPMTEEA